MFLAHS